MSQKLYHKVLRKRNRIHGGLHYLTHLVRFWCKMKKKPINLGEARKEVWRMMLIKSQDNMPPQALKSTTIKEIHKVNVAIFRIADRNMDALFGSPMLPILNSKEEMTQRLMQQVHTTHKNDYHPIHRTLESAKTALC